MRALGSAASPRDIVFAAAIGVLGGLVYRLVASRRADVLTRDGRAKITATFG